MDDDDNDPHGGMVAVTIVMLCGMAVLIVLALAGGAAMIR